MKRELWCLMFKYSLKAYTAVTLYFVQRLVIAYSSGVDANHDSKCSQLKCHAGERLALVPDQTVNSSKY